MSAIKNFYFDEINSSTNDDDFDYQYDQYMSQVLGETPSPVIEVPDEDLFSEELPGWMHNLYR